MAPVLCRCLPAALRSHRLVDARVFHHGPFVAAARRLRHDHRSPVPVLLAALDTTAAAASLTATFDLTHVATTGRIWVFATCGVTTVDELIERARTFPVGNIGPTPCCGAVFS